MLAVINNISVFAVPLMLFLIISAGAAKKVPVYDTFIEGGTEGLKSVLHIFPILLAVLTAVAMLRESGAMDILTGLLRPITDFLNIPEEIVPLALLRPISGGGSIGLLTDMLGTYGADSLAGRIASVMAGSTETTFYTIAVYFSATRAKYTRCVLPASLIGDFAGLIGSVYICNMLFGG